MEGKILTSNVRLPALEATDAFLISKIAKYVQRIDKQVCMTIFPHFMNLSTHIVFFLLRLFG